MPKVSLSQASKDTGVHLSTISRWRKDGKISADKNPDGSGYLINTSEYDRINILRKQSFQAKPPARGSMQESASLYDTPDATPQNEFVAHLKEEITFLKKELDETKQEKRELRQIIKDQNVKLLTAHVSDNGEVKESSPNTEPITPPVETPKKRFDWFPVFMVIMGAFGFLIWWVTYTYPEAVNMWLDEVLR